MPTRNRPVGDQRPDILRFVELGPSVRIQKTSDVEKTLWELTLKMGGEGQLQGFLPGGELNPKRSLEFRAVQG